MKINEQAEGLLVKIKSTNIYDPFEKQNVCRHHWTVVRLYFISPALTMLRCCFATSSRKHTQEQIKFPKVKLDPV